MANTKTRADRRERGSSRTLYMYRNNIFGQTFSFIMNQDLYIKLFIESLNVK